MTAYLLRRILFFIPTLLIITLLSFIISQSAPGDPVEQMLSGQQSGGEQIAERQANEAAYLQKRRDLGLDLPVFYFSIGPLAEPDTLYKIPKVPVQDALRRLVYKFGNWEAVQRYYQALLQLEEAFYARASDSAWKGIDRTEARALLVLLPQEKKLRRNSAQTHAFGAVFDPGPAASLRGGRVRRKNPFHRSHPLENLRSHYPLVRHAKSIPPLADGPFPG